MGFAEMLLLYGVIALILTVAILIVGIVVAVLERAGLIEVER